MNPTLHDSREVLQLPQQYDRSVMIILAELIVCYALTAFPERDANPALRGCGQFNWLFVKHGAQTSLRTRDGAI